MKTLPSGEVQNKFGGVANIVKRGESVTVTQYGTPTMMILPYDLAEAALRAYHSKQLLMLMDDMPPANADAPELTLEQIDQWVHELRP